MVLVIYPAIETERRDKIQHAAEELRIVNAPDEAAALAAMPEADAFFGKLNPELLAPARQLRWVQSPTASLEHYIFPQLVVHPCELTNMRGLFSDAIAAHVFAYILCFARNLHRYIRNQWAAKWQPVGGEDSRASFLKGPHEVTAIDRAHLELSDATLGIIGCGHIGTEVARRGQAFGMRILALDPILTTPPNGVEAIWSPDRLPDLLDQSDFVVIAAPHTPTTEKMFRREQFTRMKRTAFLINIGRGAIVDLSDLCTALQTGEVAGAGLDVFETEPLPADHPLWAMENAILTPHVAGNSPRIAERHLDVLLDNVSRFVHGRPLRNVVNKSTWF